MSLSLAERLGIPSTRTRGASPRQASGSRKSPYDRPPSPPRDTDGQWKHDKFAEVNDIAGGVLGARLFTEAARPGASTAGKTRVAVDSARLVRALGEANARNGNEGRAAPLGKTASGLEIRGASTGTTVEVRELVLGTTSADVKEIFQQHGEILSHKEVKPLPPGHTPDSVTVRLKFATQKAAEAVVEAYNGQKADGRILSVKICDAPLVEGTATLLSAGRKIDKSVDILAQPGNTSKMYSDALVNDPGAIVLTRPYVPGRGGRGGRGGRRGWRGRGARGSGMEVD